MEVRNWSGEDHGLVQIWGPNVWFLDYNQKWRLEPGLGGVALISVGSGKCLDIPLDGSPDAGKQLQQFTCHFQSNQLWTIEDVVSLCNPDAQ
jgi:hypothetical protein